mmetsp:Transcript_44717/g.83414  ORF Transcript_44717/g.83414 Transcript_44717/m.83414 type:complete len:969 (+) Transcript_44717:101-3007(+)
MRRSLLLIAAAVLVRAAAQISLDDDQQDDDEPQQRISRGGASLRGRHFASQEDAEPLEDPRSGEDPEGSVLANAFSEVIKHEADAEQAEQASERERRRCEDISEKVHDLEERLRNTELSEHKLRSQVELTERADEATRAICDKKINTLKKHSSQKLHQYQQSHRACRTQRQRLNQTLATTVKVLAEETNQRKHAESLVRDLTAKLTSVTKVLKKEEEELHLQHQKASLEGHMFHVVEAKLRQENASEIKFHTEARKAEAALADAEIQLSALQKQKARDETQAVHSIGELRAAFSQEQRLHLAAERNASSLASSLANLSRAHSQLTRKLKTTEYALAVANSDRASLTHKLAKTEKTQQQEAQAVVEEKLREQQLASAREDSEKRREAVMNELSTRSKELGESRAEDQKEKSELLRVSKELNAAQKQLSAQEARLASVQKRLEAATREARSTRAENLDLRRSLKALNVQAAEDVKRDQEKMKTDLKSIYKEAATEVESARTKMNVEVSEAKRELGAVKTEFGNMKRMKDAEESKLRTAAAQAKQELTSAYKEFAAQEELAKNRQRTDTKQLTEDGRQLGRLARELEALNKSYVEEKVAMQSKLDGAKQELTTLREKLRAMKEHEKELQYDKELSALRQQLHAAHTENIAALDQAKELKTKLWAAVERVQDEEKIEKQLESAREDEKQLDEKVKAVQKDASTLNASLSKKDVELKAASALAQKLGRELHEAQSSMNSKEHQLQTVNLAEKTLEAKLREEKTATEAKDKEEKALNKQLRETEAKLTMSNTEVEVLNKFKAETLKAASATEEKLKADLKKANSQIQKLQGEHLELLKLRTDFKAVSAVAEKQAKELRKFEHFDEKLRTELGSLAAKESKQAKEVTNLREVVAKAAELPVELRKPKAQVSQREVPQAVPQNPPLRKASPPALAEEEHSLSEEMDPEDDSENDLVSEPDDSVDDAPATQEDQVAA